MESDCFESNLFKKLTDNHICTCENITKCNYTDTEKDPVEVFGGFTTTFIGLLASWLLFLIVFWYQVMEFTSFLIFSVLTADRYVQKFVVTIVIIILSVIICHSNMNNMKRGKSCKSTIGTVNKNCFQPLKAKLAKKIDTANLSTENETFTAFILNSKGKKVYETVANIQIQSSDVKPVVLLSMDEFPLDSY